MAVVEGVLAVAVVERRSPGCNFNASARYAFLTSASEQVLSRPRRVYRFGSAASIAANFAVVCAASFFSGNGVV